MVTSSTLGVVPNRATGVALWLAAGVLAFAAWGWWLWENSDSRENERETKALTEALSGPDPYAEPEPNAAPSIGLGAISAVLFLGGAVFLANPPRGSDASDRQSERSDLR